MNGLTGINHVKTTKIKSQEGELDRKGILAQAQNEYATERNC